MYLSKGKSLKRGLCYKLFDFMVEDCSPECISYEGVFIENFELLLFFLVIASARLVFLVQLQSDRHR